MLLAVRAMKIQFIHIVYLMSVGRRRSLADEIEKLSLRTERKRYIVACLNYPWASFEETQWGSIYNWKWVHFMLTATFALSTLTADKLAQCLKELASLGDLFFFSTTHSSSTIFFTNTIFDVV